MTAHRDLKRIIRERQQKTGESYAAARIHVMRERAAVLGQDDPGPAAEEPLRLDAAVLKMNQRSVRVRVLSEAGQITFRSPDMWRVPPGQVVTLVIEKRWTWKGDAYASGSIENPRIAVDQLALEPLILRDDGLIDLRATYEPYRGKDPYAPLWRKLTAKPRPSFIMDPIAWGQLSGLDDEEENLTCEAAELVQAGQKAEAYELLMEALGTDLRCLDAHAHLGNLEFDHSPERAILHYEIGLRIGELWLPPGFDGVLLWGHIYNRPFLRCLHGYALCLWRVGQLPKAQQAFERLLSLNPNDNQGARFCWDDVCHGRGWEEDRDQEAVAGT